jgi:hypothetical protein
MSHLIDSFGFSTAIKGNVWWLGASDVDASRVTDWGKDQRPEDAYRLSLLDGAEPVVTGLHFGGEAFGSPLRSIGADQYRAYERRDGLGLIGIVGPKHRYLSNRDLFSFVPWDVQAAGSLQNGRRVFAQSRIPNIDLSINRKGGGRRLDIAPYALFYNAHDGSSKLRVRFTSTVTVCHNTVTAALSEAGVAEYSLKHTAQILDRDAVEKAIADLFEQALGSYEEQRSVLQGFAESSFSREDAKRFFATLLTDSESWEEAQPKVSEITALKRIAESKGVSDRSVSIFVNKGAELLNLFERGIGQVAGEDKVKIDALQAVTEFIDHQRSRSATWKAKAANFSSGLNSSLFGDGHAIKQKAVRLLAKW